MDALIYLKWLTSLSLDLGLPLECCSRGYGGPDYKDWRQSGRLLDKLDDERNCGPHVLPTYNRENKTIL